MKASFFINKQPKRVSSQNKEEIFLKFLSFYAKLSTK